MTMNPTVPSLPVEVLSQGMFHRLFSENTQLIPHLNEVYELALAFYESRILDEDELIRNSAYFSRIEGIQTHHYRMCIGDPLRLPESSSSRLKSFFSKNQFRTGYATHGLFPYRGKFHPQMIKAIINVMGLKAGNIILDPMMGSGTVLVEAATMGIRSIGFDVSPFCCFMSQVKIDAFSIPTKPLHQARSNVSDLFKLFSTRVGVADRGIKYRSLSFSNGQTREPEEKYSSLDQSFMDMVGSENPAVHNFLLLAYLDSAGHAERSNRKSPIERFKEVLERYIFVVKKIQLVIELLNLKLSETCVMEGDARDIPLQSECVDGILFSPPYSFAIDYLKNDSFHLNCLGTDVRSLKRRMIGLRGKSLRDRYHQYIEDIDRVLEECGRVLRRNRLCTIIIGTNDNQLSKALSIPKNQVRGLHQVVIETASKYGFSPLRTLSRQISGIANTMRNEYIVILKRD